MSTQAIVEGELLRWGRETAGLAVEEAARRVQVSPERVTSWEANEAKPTMRQLRLLAKAYRRPLNIFFLEEPPAEPALDIHDFLHLPGIAPGDVSSNVRLRMRDAQERRQLALDLYAELGELPRHIDLAANLNLRLKT